MRAIAHTVIPCEDNPATPAYFPEPLLITRGLREMIIMHLDLYSSLSEGIGDEVLDETAIEEKDKRVYAAWVLSSYRMASSMSCGERS